MHTKSKTEWIDDTLYPDYDSAQKHQLEEWVAGRPKHNPFAPGCDTVEESQGGECCHDFSCCCPSMLADEPARVSFAKAHRAKQEGMLIGFLSAFCAQAGNVVIVSSVGIDCDYYAEEGESDD